MTISVDGFALTNRVVLAPMTGVTDLPFRRAVMACGAAMVVSEMVASEEFVRGRKEARDRARLSSEIGPKIIQLAGCEDSWMREAAIIAEGEGAEIIDINMGCPAKRVANRQSGSALMRDLKHALSLIDAVVAAVSVPVTLKMRLGWDHASINAPELARIAEQAGVKLITVHGRTRCQFYDGNADWSAVRAVKDAVAVPVIVNGDICSEADALKALDFSGADGVMIGRAALGKPWLLRRVAAAISRETTPADPTIEEIQALVLRQYEESLELYGSVLGNKVVRKHLTAYADNLADPNAFRAAACRSTNPAEVRALIVAHFVSRDERRAA